MDLSARSTVSNQDQNDLSRENSAVNFDSLRKKKKISSNNGMVCDVEKIEKLKKIFTNSLTEKKFTHIVKSVLQLITSVVNCRHPTLFVLEG